MSDNQHEIRGVEIFRAGEWNGDVYSTADIDEMVRAADEVGYRVPVKVGHETPPGAPASGWVTNLRRVGDRLVADLVALPARVYEAIKQRAYDSVSVEIFWDLKRAGRTFKRALKALALLGAETPAVDLPPLSSFLSEMQSARCVTYAITLEPAPAPTGPLWQRAGAVLEALAKQRGVSFRHVAGEHPDVFQIYSDKEV
jgi:hypothetical protein